MNGPRNKAYGTSASKVAVNSEFQRVDKPDRHDLIDAIENKRQQERSHRSPPALVEQLQTPLRAREYRPQVALPALPRILNAGTQGQQARHRRLNVEPQTQRAIRPREKILPTAANHFQQHAHCAKPERREERAYLTSEAVQSLLRRRRAETLFAPRETWNFTRKNDRSFAAPRPDRARGRRVMMVRMMFMGMNFMNKWG